MLQKRTMHHRKPEVCQDAMPALSDILRNIETIICYLDQKIKEKKKHLYERRPLKPNIRKIKKPFQRKQHFDGKASERKPNQDCPSYWQTFSSKDALRKRKKCFLRFAFFRFIVGIAHRDMLLVYSIPWSSNLMQFLKLSHHTRKGRRDIPADFQFSATHAFFFSFFFFCNTEFTVFFFFLSNTQHS